MDNITTAFVKQFQQNVMFLVQQKGSRLRDTVYLKPGVVGEEVYQDQIGPDTATKKTTRNADTPITNPDHRRRKIFMYDYEVAKLLDKEDKLKMLIDPTSDYVVNGANALGRAMDDAIIAAHAATAYTGKEGGTSQSFDANNQIAAGGAGLTLAKLRNARKLLRASDVDEDELLFIIVAAAQMDDLLNTTEVTSADYNSVKALVTGSIDSFMGFKFIHSERLETDDSSSRLVPVYAKTGICLAVAADITARVSERADKSYATQTYLSMGIGATRLEEAKCVQIACTES